MRPAWYQQDPDRIGFTDHLTPMHASPLAFRAKGEQRLRGDERRLASQRVGCATHALGEAQIADRLRIGFVFADGKLFNQLTLAENVALPLRYQKNLAAAEADRAVAVLLEMLELLQREPDTPTASLLGSWLNTEKHECAARLLGFEDLLEDEQKSQREFLDALERLRKERHRRRLEGELAALGGLPHRSEEQKARYLQLLMELRAGLS